LSAASESEQAASAKKATARTTFINFIFVYKKGEASNGLPSKKENGSI